MSACQAPSYPKQNIRSDGPASLGFPDSEIPYLEIMMLDVCHDHHLIDLLDLALLDILSVLDYLVVINQILLCQPLKEVQLELSRLILKVVGLALFVEIFVMVIDEGFDVT